MDKCPHCGSEEYYVVCHMKGQANYYYRFDGKSANNSELHTHLDYKCNKTMFCSDCDRKLGVKQ